MLSAAPRSAAATWFVRPRPHPQPRLRLFCLPYAGGGASVYHPWSRELPPEIELCAVQLPGREHRMAEPPATSVAALVPTLAAALDGLLDRPFALFGHSLGALLAFELTRTLLGKGIAPAHLFVSGRPAPQLPRRDPPAHNLPEPAFIERLRQYNGTPEVILADPELRELFLPILRADFALLETYSHQPGTPLPCPITALGGTDDHAIAAADLEAWRIQTSGPFALHMFPGGHFFLRSEQRNVLSLLTRSLAHIG